MYKKAEPLHVRNPARSTTEKFHHGKRKKFLEPRSASNGHQILDSFSAPGKQHLRE
jgi:hypothetical protein